MIYTVVWKSAAQDELADIWNSAQNRQSVTDAANQVDQLLKTAPHEQGEARSGTLRILFVEPIGVIFDVNDQDRIVSVVQVWTI